MNSFELLYMYIMLLSFANKLIENKTQSSCEEKVGFLVTLREGSLYIHVTTRTVTEVWIEGMCVSYIGSLFVLQHISQGDLLGAGRGKIG